MPNRQGEAGKCAIWGTDAEHLATGSGDAAGRDSPRAGGRYIISGTATMMMGDFTDEQKVALTDLVVEVNQFGGTANLDSNSIRYARNARPMGINARANNLLVFLARSQNKVSDSFRVNWQKREYMHPALSSFEPYALAYSSSQDYKELAYIVEYLVERGFISSKSLASGSFNYKITPRGHEYVETLLGPNPGSTTAFVAMWFDKSMNEAYVEGIKPGIEDAGYDAVRILDVQHNDKIDDRILAEIRKSKFLVVDASCGSFVENEEEKFVTRGAVYFEAGFALGLNIPVIWTCKSSALQSLCFDTRQYNHIVWETPEGLREDLRNRIEAILGVGPNKQQRT